jgi:hypothetical protein
MNHKDKVKAILFIRPNAEFVLEGDELNWLDTNQTEPTNAEIEAGWVAYQATQETEAQMKAQAKAVLLERLGLTQEEFNILTAQS